MAGLVVSYGCTGIGKTVDICRCFRGGIVLLTDKDGLRAVQTLDNRTPRHIRLANREAPLVEAQDAVRKSIVPLVAQKRASAVIVSTATELAYRMLAVELPAKKDPRQAYQAVHMQFMPFVEELIDLGVWVVLECHEAKPSEEEYRVRPGGPKFPSAGLMEDVCYLASLVLRAKYDTKGDRVYQCVRNDVLWTMKDRYNVTEDEQPLDMLALLKKTRAGNSAQPR